jgi:hypothetical protein
MLAAASRRRPATPCMHPCPNYVLSLLSWWPPLAAQGAMWVYESVVSPTLKQVSQEARKVPALQKALDKLDAFTVRRFRCLFCFFSVLSCFALFCEVSIVSSVLFCFALFCEVSIVLYVSRLQSSWTGCGVLSLRWVGLQTQLATRCSASRQLSNAHARLRIGVSKVTFFNFRASHRRPASQWSRPTLARSSERGGAAEPAAAPAGCVSAPRSAASVGRCGPRAGGPGFQRPAEGPDRRMQAPQGGRSKAALWRQGGTACRGCPVLPSPPCFCTRA